MVLIGLQNMKINILSIENLKKTNTSRLLGILRSVTAKISFLDNSNPDIDEEYEWGIIWSGFKSTKENLIKYRNQIKEILKTREHVEKKPKCRKRPNY